MIAMILVSISRVLTFARRGAIMHLVWDSGSVTVRLGSCLEVIIYSFRGRQRVAARQGSCLVGVTL